MVCDHAEFQDKAEANWSRVRTSSEMLRNSEHREPEATKGATRAQVAEIHATALHCHGAHGMPFMQEDDHFYTST